MDWDKWSAVLYVARAGSLSGAATALRLDATTVGRRIKSLEDSLGSQLFFRDGRRFVPTRKCSEMLVHLETAATALATAQNSMFDPSHVGFLRSFRLSAPPYFVDHILASRLDTLLSERRLQIELMPETRIRGLTTGTLDSAIVIDDRPKGITWDKTRITSKVLGNLRYRMYHKKGSDLESLPWAGLAEQPDIRTGSLLMNKLAGSRGPQIRVRHFEALAQIAANGTARALLPEGVATRHSKLAAASDVLLEQPVIMLSNKQDEKTGYLAACRGWVTETIQSALQ